MASPFGTCGLNKPAPAAFATNKHLSPLPSPPVVSIPRKMKMRHQRKCRFTVNAAKEIHFNKDGSAIRKLQVTQLTNIITPLLLLFISSLFFFFFSADTVFFLRMASISLQISSGLLLDQKDEM